MRAFCILAFHCLSSLIKLVGFICIVLYDCLSILHEDRTSKLITKVKLKLIFHLSLFRQLYACIVFSLLRQHIKIHISWSVLVSKIKRENNLDKKKNVFFNFFCQLSKFTYKNILLLVHLYNFIFIFCVYKY